MCVRRRPLSIIAFALAGAAIGVSSDGAVLSNNLSETSGGTETATGSQWLAASFTTESTTSTLSSITLLMDQSSPGSAVVNVYADDSIGQPGTLVATLTSPASYSSSLTNTTFTSSGTTLAANTTYWTVLSAASGSFDWSDAADDTGTGTGFTHIWAESFDAGADWFTDDTYPLQMSVVTAPEPSAGALVIGAALASAARRRRVKA